MKFPSFTIYEAILGSVVGLSLAISTLAFTQPKGQPAPVPTVAVSPQPDRQKELNAVATVLDKLCQSRKMGRLVQATGPVAYLIDTVNCEHGTMRLRLQ